MLDYVGELEPLLMLVLGWAMGLLSPTIVEKIRRRYKQRDLMNAVVDEFLGLQYTMTMVAWIHRARNAEVTDSFLDSIIPIIEQYKGPDRNEEMITAMKRSRERPEQDRIAHHKVMRKPESGLSVKQYALPLFVSQMADLSMCPIDFQRAVLNIRYHLDLYNQSIPLLQSLFDKTFASLTEENLAIIRANIEQGYKDVGQRAEIIKNAISELRMRFST
ncbi:MAG TPA: hypothetical protein VFA33_26595 [Bryobacteraceae bacterium]|nr:hypothetical protein [Bryobacteraceae bacterium]